MRILLAAHAFLPRSTAGVEVYTDRLARALQRRGHEVSVLAAVYDLAAEPCSLRSREQEGLRVHEIVNVHEGGTLAASYEAPGLLEPLRGLLDLIRPEVVHLQHLLNLPAGLVDLARGQGAAVLLTLHDHWLGCARDGLRMRADLSLCHEVEPLTCARCLQDSPYLVPGLQRGVAGVARRVGLGGTLQHLHKVAPRLVEGLLHGARRLQPPPEARLRDDVEVRTRRLLEVAQRLDRVLAPTRFVRDRALELGIDPLRIECLPLGAVGPARARVAGPRRRFAFVGTVAPHKGVHVLVEAFRAVDRDDVTLDVHGSLTVQPAYAARVQSLAAGDARIRFHGGFAEGRQGSILDACDALVVPSVWWENSPLTVLEAVAAGRPVVASLTGGIPELVPDGAGVLVPPGDVPALTAALTALAEGRLLGESAPPFALKTTDAGAAELEVRYGALIGPGARPHA